jgi:hypothetical protein
LLPNTPYHNGNNMLPSDFSVMPLGLLDAPSVAGNPWQLFRGESFPQVRRETSEHFCRIDVSGSIWNRKKDKSANAACAA